MESIAKQTAFIYAQDEVVAGSRHGAQAKTDPPYGRLKERNPDERPGHPEPEKMGPGSKSGMTGSWRTRTYTTHSAFPTAS